MKLRLQCVREKPERSKGSSAVQVSQLPSRELVPGDVVELHAGDRVPADLRIVAMKTATLRAEQSSLTGESVAVNKGAAPGAEEGCELQARCFGNVG